MKIIKVSKYISFKNILFLTGLVIVLIYLSHYYLQRNEIVVYTHDNLDSNIPYFKVLAENGYIFSSRDTIVEPIMGGLPRSCFQSPLNIIWILHILFKTSTAYIINEILIHLIAYIGMFFLLKKHIFSDNSSWEQALSVGVAVAFSLIPFWHSGGITVAGQPLLLYAILNIKNKDLSVKNWIIIVLFPFYSSLILSGMFIIAALILVLMLDYIKNKILNKELSISISLLILLYVIVEHQLFLNILDPLFISHRVEFAGENWNLKEVLLRSRKLLTMGQYHAHSLHTLYIFPVIIFFSINEIITSKKNTIFLSLIISLLSIVFILDIFKVIDLNTIITQIVTNSFYNIIPTLLFLIVIVLFVKKKTTEAYILCGILCISYFYGIWWSKHLNILKNHILLFKQIQFDRFYFLLPILWYLLLALFLKNYKGNRIIGSLFLIIFLISQVNYSFKMKIGEKWMGHVSMKEYYAKSMFDEIKDYINKPVNEYKIINISLNPAITIYNGFFTLDGYIPNYPLTYKHEFRKIMAAELEKNDRNKNYFDGWGGRCYLFYGTVDVPTTTINQLDIDIEQLKKMGANYIFSKYRIGNYTDINLKYLRSFDNPYAGWDIFLYEIN